MRALVLNAGPDAPLAWATLQESGRARTGIASGYAALPEEVMLAERTILVLPGELAASRRLRLPVRGDRALAEAAALAFDDVLAEPVDGFHFAFGAAEDEGSRWISALPEDWITGETAHAQSEGFDPQIVSLDHLMLPREIGTAVLLRDGARAAFASDEGAASGETRFIEALAAHAAEGIPLMQIRVGDAPLSEAGIHLADHAAMAGHLLAANRDAEIPSFRRGRLAKRRALFAGVAQWRVAASLAAACLVLALIGVGADGLRHARAASYVEETARARFAAAFPDVTIRDLPRQARARAGGSSGGAFMPLMTSLTSALEQSDEITLSAIQYTPDGELAADLQFPDAAAIETLKAQLEAEGVPVREGGNLRRQDNGDYTGRLFLGDLS